METANIIVDAIEILIIALLSSCIMLGFASLSKYFRNRITKNDLINRINDMSDELLNTKIELEELKELVNNERPKHTNQQYNPSNW